MNPDDAPAFPDKRSEFAACYVARGFRLREVCSTLGMDPSEAQALLLDTETAAHLERLTTTGELAQALPTARMVLEQYDYVAGMTIEGFAAKCRAAGIDTKTQSVPAFLKAKVGATLAFQKAAHPSLMDLWREHLRMLRNKGGGRSVDQLAARKKFMTEIDELLMKARGTDA